MRRVTYNIVKALLIVATLFGFDNIFIEHQTGHHPERPTRLTSIMEAIKADEVWKELVQADSKVQPDEWITINHSEEYMSRFKDACENDMPFFDSHECNISEKSYEAASKAVSMSLTACDMIMAETVRNGFLAVRPPGHHAEYDQALGFCFFNNAAVAARYVQKKHNLKRVLILDWDCHHGNGTQNSFYRDGTVFYASLHQHPATLFPGTGWPQEFGDGPGRGTTLNMPLAPGSGDEDVLELFKDNFLPVAKEFRPDFIIISAGFDAHAKDPLSQMNMSNKGFDILSNEMLDLADECCKGRVLSLLEGGYHLEQLSRCVVNHMRILNARSAC